jgi:ribosome-binding protein aMBF1 (putative translation factor)
MSNSLRKQEESVETAAPAKRLALRSSSLRTSLQRSRPVSGDSREAKEPQRDSANFEAAKQLRCSRLESGLTQEELAVLAGESVNAIARRERGEVWLGPARQAVIIGRATAAKFKVVK